MRSTYSSRYRTSLWLLVALAAAAILVLLPFLLDSAFAFAATLLCLAAAP